MVDVVFFFGDSADRNSLYQLRQWLGPLKRLSGRASVSIVCSSQQAQQAGTGAGIETHRAGSMAAAMGLARSLQPKVILYPNQFYENYPLWGDLDATHVFVSHGESDKSYMSQNSAKYFDYLFVAGEIAIDRLRANVHSFSLDRCIKIGRPQLLDVTPPIPEVFLHDDSDRSVILYAPTWEGSLAVNRYGSVVSHGYEIVQEILQNSDKYRLIYKPHPFTGSMIPEWGEENKRIIELIQRAEDGHLVDYSPFGWQPKVADLMITDVSAVAYDWLATGKPLILTRPEEPRAEIFTSGIFGSWELLSAEDAPDTARWISKSLNDQAMLSEINAWSRRYFESAITQDGSERFIEETLKLVRNNKRSSQERKLVQTTAKPKLIHKAVRSAIRALPLGLKLGLKRFAGKVVNRKVPEVPRLLAFLDSSRRISMDHLAALTTLLGGGSTEVIVVSSLTTFAHIQLRRLWSRPLLRSLKVRYVTSAQDIAATIMLTKAGEICYLSHCMDNHFGVRLNTPTHTLFMPELDPHLRVDHNLIAYDSIKTSDSKIREKFQQRVMHPQGFNFR